MNSQCGGLTILLACCFSEFLDIWDVNMLAKPDEINKREHHTSLYSNPLLIVRRAQEFQIRITFNRAYNPSKDQFLVEFVIGGSLPFYDILH